jgi:hypothetical protein
VDQETDEWARIRRVVDAMLRVMGEEARSEIERLLGPAAADALAGLSDRDAGHLAGLLADARDTERKAMQEAAESSLSFVPRFARGTVKKIVFSG